MKQPNLQPPSLATRLLVWFIAPHLLEAIQGDLYEGFQYNVVNLGIGKARWLYWREVFGFFRPMYIKRKQNLYSSSSTISHIMIRNYFKIAFRNIKNNKAYTLINVSGLTLGMTCGLIIFMLVKYHLSFDNFHSNADRVYRIVTEQHRDNVSYQRSVPAPLGKVFRNEYTFAENVARITTYNQALISLRNGNELKKFREEEGVAFAETDFFEIFNYPLLEGNKQTVLTEPNTAIMTQKTAKKYFGDQNPIGKVFWFDNKIAFTVTGILKDFPENTDRKTGIYASYVTLKTYDSWLGSDDSWGGINSSVQCFVRLRPGVSVAQVEKVFPAYPKKYRPNSKNVHHYKLQPLSEVHFDARYDGPMEKRNLWILSVIGLFLIATACVNFVNLATAQAFKRSKEVGVRKVLGGLQAQLFWQFISETFLISALAIVVSVVLSYLVLPVVNSFFNTQMSLNVFTDVQLILFVLGLGIIVTFFAGSYPGLVLARFQPIIALKGKLSQASIGGFNTRRMLIVAQFTISQMLIIGMVVIVSQMQYTRQADLGFNKDAIVMIPLGIDTTGVKMKTLKSQIEDIAGVEKATLCFAAPSSQQAWNTGIRFDNQLEDVSFQTSIKAADADYVPTFGLQMVAGRNVFPADSVKEFLVNEAFTRKLNFKTPQDVIGKVIGANGGTMEGPIVGIVKDFHDRSLHEDITPVAITTYNDNYSALAVKVNLSNVKNTLVALEQAWIAKYPDQIFESQFLDENIARFYETEDRMLKLIEMFSFIAILIGSLGLYGLVSFMAAQKTKEIGIRKVLGSGVTQILWIFGKEFSMLILVAFVIAAPVGWWVMNSWLQDFKFRIQMNFWTFASAIFITFFIAAITVAYKSLRAALLDPVKSLRSE